MPRAGPIYTLPEAAFVPNTSILSASVNSDLDDIATALTNSLARDGSGGMTAVLPLAVDGFTYLVDPNTGMHRTAGDTQAIECGGTDVLTATTTGVSITGTLAVSGAFTVGGALLLPIGLGPLPWSGLTAPTKWLLCYGQTLLRADFPDLWTFIAAEIAGGNTLFTNGNGSTTFTMPDMRGRLPAGKDNMGGSAASRLTATTMTPDGQTLGAVGGTQTETLTANQIPSITSAGTNSIVVGPASGFVLVANSSSITDFPSTPGSGLRAPGSTASMSSSGTMMNGTNSISVTSNNTGGAAHPNVQPTIVTNYILYAGV